MPLLPRATLAACLLVALATPAGAAGGFPLLPGSIAGDVNNVDVKRGETLRWVAMRYGVNPVRVKPVSAGMPEATVDTRHVVPAFAPGTNGIVLNVPEAEVYLVKDGEIEKHYPVAVSAPDKPVPLGRTHVVSKEKNPPWFIPPSIQKTRGKNAKTVVPPGPNNPLGPRWLGFWDGSFGFHGTNVPTSIKQYASHGCVRFRAGDIKDLYERVAVGTPVHVVYQPVVLGVDDSSIWVQVYPDIYKKGFDYKDAIATLARQTGQQERVNWKAVSHAIALHNGIITNVGPGSSFRGQDDPTATIEEAAGGHAAVAVVHRKPAPKPLPKPTPVIQVQPGERLIPEDQMPDAADNVLPEAPSSESTPAPWFTQP